MMISECLSGSNFQPEGIKRIPEALGIAKPAERDSSPARESCDMFTVHVSPAERLNARPEDGRVRVNFAEPLGNGSETYVGITTGHDKHAGSTEGCKRLAQAASRDNLLPAKWVERVDQDDVDVAIQKRVLETVIENENIARRKFTPKQLRDPIPIRSDSYRDTCAAKEDLRFITGI